jgi:phosphoribosyl 1,2-cyclic phosphodiesterase
MGVRGSVPTPAAEFLGFGGNTTCLEVRSTENDRVVIDAGSGVRGLNRSLLENPAKEDLQFHILMTHFHWDHIQGLPFFAPLFSPACGVTFYSGKAPEILRQILDLQMSDPYFPALGSVAAAREFVEIGNQPFRHGHITIHPFPLNHPQGAWGYRMESGGAVIVHASDLEHGHPKLDSVLREYAQNADVLIYDAQYTGEEYESRKGWGHSTWLEATRVARDAGVKHLILFHHDPLRDDDALRCIVNQARRNFENTDAAEEGCVLSV